MPQASKYVEFLRHLLITTFIIFKSVWTTSTTLYWCQIKITQCCSLWHFLIKTSNIPKKLSDSNLSINCSVIGGKNTSDEFLRKNNNNSCLSKHVCALHIIFSIQPALFVYYFICNCRFPCDVYLNNHLKKKHNTSKGFKCDQCDLVTSTPKALQRHTRKVHLPRDPEQCNYCGNLYATRATLTKHILNMHVLVDKEHRCEICGFVSSTKEAKRKHIEFRHNPVKNHKCTMCEKAFKTPTLLKVSI